MIRHIVMFEFLNEAEGKTATQNAVIAKDKLLALKDKISVIRRMEIGINDGEADETNYTLCLTVDFDNFDDLNAYAVHPEHLEAAAFIGKVRLSRACVDYEI
ncbi:MAG: Dabb family protein [bacterium]|nr:Dabb family protein [bacterium]